LSIAGTPEPGPASLAEAAVAVLRTADPGAKVQLSRRFAAAWVAGDIVEVGAAEPPARPARPALKAPREMPRRRSGRSESGRQALFHALAHIELNALDLAWDLIARFTGEDLPRPFYDDWVAVADDEARHFTLLAARLAALGGAYGDLPAHDGLWQAASDTRHDLLARLAVVPLVLEARGLDVTPGMITRFESYGDQATATILKTIYEDEIGHVRAGARWFHEVCKTRGMPPEATYQKLVKQQFSGQLKPPFNTLARTMAGLPEAYYSPIAAK